MRRPYYYYESGQMTMTVLRIMYTALFSLVPLSRSLHEISDVTRIDKV